MTRREIAIMGGTYDPCHRGHIEMAKYIANNYLADEVWMIPSYDSPHKCIDTIKSYDDRVNMLKLATNHMENIKISTIEKDYYDIYHTKTYSNEILKYIRNKFSNIYIYLVVGFDSIKQIHTWHDYKELLKSNDFYIFNRKDKEFTTIEQKKYYLDNLGIKSNFKFHYDLFDVDIKDVSSTQIRDILKNNRHDKNEIIKFLDENVYDYIIEKKLYN